MELSKRKFTTVVFAIAFISMLLTGTVFYVFAPNASNTIFVEQGVYPGGAAYTIWRVGTTFYAKDSNGQIPSWGTSSNCSTVVNTATYAAYNDSGGEIFFLNGEYPTQIGFIIRENITYSGEGWGTVLYWNGSDPAYMLGVIRGDEDGGTEENVIIRNLHIRGNGDASGTGHVKVAGIYWNYTAGDYSVDGLTVENCKFSGKLERAIHAEDSINCIIDKNRVYRLQKSGIGSVTQNSIISSNIVENRKANEGGDNCLEIIGDPNEPLWGYNVTIVNNQFYYGITAIEIRLAHNIKVFNNKIVEPSHYGAKVGQDGYTFQPTGIDLVSNEFIGCGILEQYNAIDYNATGKIDGNTVTRSGDNGIVVHFSNGSSISENTIVDVGMNKSSTNVYSILLDEDCVHNTIANNIMRVETTSYMRGLHESDGTSDYNIYTGNDAYFCYAPAIQVIHSNSKIVGCWNGTTWLSPDG